MEKVTFEDAGLEEPTKVLNVDAEYEVFKTAFYSEETLSKQGVMDFTVLLKGDKPILVRGEFVSGAGQEPWGLSVLNMLVTCAYEVEGVDEDGDVVLTQLQLPKKVTLMVCAHNVLTVMTEMAQDFQTAEARAEEFLKSVVKKEK